MKYSTETKFCEVCGKTTDSAKTPHSKFIDCPKDKIDNYLNKSFQKMAEDVGFYEED